MNALTQAEKEARQIRMYGVTVAEMRRQFEEAMRMGGPKMLAVSQLSDAQEEISLGLQEEARQTINRAKWLIMELLSEPLGPNSPFAR